MYLGSDRASKGVSEVSAVVGAGPKAFVARGQRSGGRAYVPRLRARAFSTAINQGQSRRL